LQSAGSCIDYKNSQFAKHKGFCMHRDIVEGILLLKRKFDLQTATYVEKKIAELYNMLNSYIAPKVEETKPAVNPGINIEPEFLEVGHPLYGAHTDIDLGFAQRAHNGTSFSPEKRGVQAVNDYSSSLKSVYDHSMNKANAEHKDLVLSMFVGFRKKFRDLTLQWLAAKGRTMSTMITGRGNFPVASNQKKLDAEHRRLTELIEYQNKFEERVKKATMPEENKPIMSGEANAVQKLEAKKASLIETRTTMLELNKVIRKFRNKKINESQLATEVERIYPKGAQSLMKELKEQNYPLFYTVNDAAEIRRLDSRIAIEKRLQEQAQKVESGEIKLKRWELPEGGYMEANPGISRYQIIFPSIPSSGLRTRLKKIGFKWAPSQNAWVNYLSDSTLYKFKREFGL